MKKIAIILLCLIMILAFIACNNPQGDMEIVNPPLGDGENSDNDQNGDEIGKPSQNEYAYYVRSVTNSLNVRSSPSASSSLLGTLDKGDMVLHYGREGEWYKTIYKERTAYVSASHCELVRTTVADEKVESVLAFGATLLGYPYVWGSQRYHWGNGQKNPAFVNGKFDCSAFVQYVYYIKQGVILDVTTRTQAVQGEAVSKDNIKRGDLLFFTNSSRDHLSGLERIGHVAIYLSDNYILHTSSDHAVIEPISSARWNYYICARRVI